MAKIVSPRFGRLYWLNIAVAFAIGIALVLAAEPFLPQPDSLPTVRRPQATTLQIPQKFEPQIPQKFEVVDGSLDLHPGDAVTPGKQQTDPQPRASDTPAASPRSDSNFLQLATSLPTLGLSRTTTFLPLRTDSNMPRRPADCGSPESIGRVAVSGA